MNALGTLNLLEACRQFCPNSPFVHMSTNKVYGDGPNSIKLKELSLGGNTTTLILQKAYCKLFPLINANTLYLGLLRLRPMLWYRNMAAILVWQHVAYVRLPDGAFHSAELHGFLSYLANALRKKPTIYSDTKGNRYAIISTPKMLPHLSNVSSGSEIRAGL